MPSVAAAAAEKRRSGLRACTSKVAPSKLQGIRVFGTIGKPQVTELGKSNLKRKHIEEAPNVEIPHPLELTNLKKRKLGPAEDVLDFPKPVQKQAEQQPVGNGARKRKVSEEPATTTTTTTPPPPQHLLKAAKNSKRQKTALRSSPLTNTPTAGARSLLEQFAIGASSSRAKDPSPTPVKYETPPFSPPSLADAESEDLPGALQDLVNLHSSFLTALSLYYAHNGPCNPADLRNLYPGIERTWKKRRVNIEDVRRILAVGQDESPEETKKKEEEGKDLLYLSDYGHNRICVEVSDHALQYQRRVIDEENLNLSFTSSLSKKWSLFKKQPTIGTPSPTAFISHLPLLPITTSTSLTDLKPLLAKGQNRLSDLKASAIAAQHRNNNALSHTAAPNTTNHSTTPITLSSSSPSPSDNKITATIPTKARATSLLDRLAAKAQQQSTLPHPPTKSQLARKRALQRLPEIAPVLQSLAVGGQKHDNGDTTAAAEYADGPAAIARERRTMLVQRQVSFTMATVVHVLQGSLRNPIARDEAVGCVRLMAEVVPEWVSIREVGRCMGVIVRGGGAGLGRGELEGRVRLLLLKDDGMEEGLREQK